MNILKPLASAIGAVTTAVAVVTSTPSIGSELESIHPALNMDSLMTTIFGELDYPIKPLQPDPENPVLNAKFGAVPGLESHNDDALITTVFFDEHHAAAERRPHRTNWPRPKGSYSVDASELNFGTLGFEDAVRYPDPDPDKWPPPPAKQSVEKAFVGFSVEYQDSAAERPPHRPNWPRPKSSYSVDAAVSFKDPSIHPISPVLMMMAEMKTPVMPYAAAPVTGGGKPGYIKMADPGVYPIQPLPFVSNDIYAAKERPSHRPNWPHIR